MGTITYQLPQAGQPNSVADPEVATALQTLLTWADGNVDTNNLSASAGITKGQLAAGVARLVPTLANANANAADGNLYQCGTAGVTLTLPAPTAGTTIGFLTYAGVTGSSPLTIARSAAATIFGTGVSGATSVVLGTVGAAMVLWADGANWFIISGGQDTGWVPLTLPANWATPAGYYTPAVRVVGVIAMTRGAAQNNTGGAATYGGNNLAAATPAKNVIAVAYNSFTSNGVGLTFSSSGFITGGSAVAASGIQGFEGVSYPIAV